jgi:hypothetical protein
MKIINYEMTKVTNLKCFFIVSTGFIFLIIGASLLSSFTACNNGCTYTCDNYKNSKNNCYDCCYNMCHDKCGGGLLVP